MAKIKISSKSFLLKLFVADILIQGISLLISSALFSLITYYLDLDIENLKRFTYIIVVFVSFISSIFVTKKLKNNGIFVGIISQVPLFIYLLITVIVSKGSFADFGFKFLLILIFGAIGGILGVNKKEKFKVK